MINQKNYSSGKNNKKNNGPRIGIFCSKIVYKTPAEKINVFGLRDLLLMGLGQGQKQDPSVHSWGGSMAVPVGVSDM